MRRVGQGKWATKWATKWADYWWRQVTFTLSWSYLTVRVVKMRVKSKMKNTFEFLRTRNRATERSSARLCRPGAGNAAYVLTTINWPPTPPPSHHHYSLHFPPSGKRSRFLYLLTCGLLFHRRLEGKRKRRLSVPEPFASWPRTRCSSSKYPYGCYSSEHQVLL
jgi:hypothetical protein